MRARARQVESVVGMAHLLLSFSQVRFEGDMPDLQAVELMDPIEEAKHVDANKGGPCEGVLEVNGEAEEDKEEESSLRSLSKPQDTVDKSTKNTRVKWRRVGAVANLQAIKVASRLDHKELLLPGIPRGGLDNDTNRRGRGVLRDLKQGGEKSNSIVEDEIS